MSEEKTLEKQMKLEINQLKEFQQKNIPLITTCPLCFTEIPFHMDYFHLVHCLPAVNINEI